MQCELSGNRVDAACRFAQNKRMMTILRCPRRWGAIAVFSAVAGTWVCAHAAKPLMPPPAPRRPNIVLIVADGLGYGDLGCYGQTRIKTPNLDELAAEGVRFTDFYAGSTVGAPSRCALMTGLDTGHAYIRGNTELALRPQDVTMAELLQKSGYHTGLLGNWGLGNPNTMGMPQDHGFDEFGGYLDQAHAEDYFTDYLWRYDPHHGFSKMQLVENAGGKEALYTPDLLLTGALNFMRINEPDEFNHHRPFFLYFASTLPRANSQEARRSGNGMEVPDDTPYSGEPWPQAEKNKAAMITRLDAAVGKIVAKLKELKLDDNTIILFTSDNGPQGGGDVDPAFFSSAGPLRGLKGDLHEGGIRVPLLVRWPSKIRAGRVSHLPCAFWDILPTACQIAGLKPPAQVDGISLLPELEGLTQTNRHPYLYWEVGKRGFQQALRLGDWKAIRPAPGAALELYDLVSDLGEKHNVADQHPDVVARIEGLLKQARTDSAAFPIGKPEEKQTVKAS